MQVYLAILVVLKSLPSISDEPRELSDGYGPSTSWDHESVFDPQFDDGNIHSDEEDVDKLVSQPRQVVFQFVNACFVSCPLLSVQFNEILLPWKIVSFFIH